MEYILLKLGLYWQYPVITEKEFYRQNRENKEYIGFPWATIIDMNINLDELLKVLKNIFKNESKNNYTCCQHIFFRKLKKIWKELNITCVYTPHKVIEEDYLEDIKLISCPLYAVNLEDISRNIIFKECDFLKKNRRYLYSFVGGYSDFYLSNIRKKIFELNVIGREDIIIINTGGWHFNCDVYEGGQNIMGELNENDIHKKKTDRYNSILLDSRYSLVPSGSGPNSIRLWESLGCGSIPILLADTLDLPIHKLWDKAIIRIKESELNNIDNILNNIDNNKELELRENCIKLYKYFKNNYKNNIILDKDFLNM